MCLPCFLVEIKWVLPSQKHKRDNFMYEDCKGILSCLFSLDNSYQAYYNLDLNIFISQLLYLWFFRIESSQFEVYYL